MLILMRCIESSLTCTPVLDPSWDCSRANSLNFGVLTEPEASELPKGLVLKKVGMYI